MLLAVFFRTFCRCTETHLHWIIFWTEQNENENLPWRLILFLKLNYQLEPHVKVSSLLRSHDSLSASHLHKPLSERGSTTLTKSENERKSSNRQTIVAFDENTSTLASLIIFKAYRQKFSFKAREERELLEYWCDVRKQITFMLNFMFMLSNS